MIRINRLDLEPKLAERLLVLTTDLATGQATSEVARRKWDSASKARNGVRERLASMAHGVRRCMYCGDNLGTDIDHFQPISAAPLRTFDWLNHLLACAFCNSNAKRDAYPCDATGACLLIDPASEDPRAHLYLRLNDGEYKPRTQKGAETIRVFGLNRGDLVVGRLNAFQTRRAVLCHAYDLLVTGREDEAVPVLRALAEEPHASVLQQMIVTRELPGAIEVLGADVVEALNDPRIRELLSDRLMV